MDRNGEHGLKVEKIGPTFSSFIDTPTMYACKNPPNLLFFALPDEICFILVLSSIHNSTGWGTFCVGTELT